jgi:hypothetical protein
MKLTIGLHPRFQRDAGSVRNSAFFDEAELIMRIKINLKPHLQ